MDIINKSAKASIWGIVMGFVFFSSYSGLIVEGSPSTIVNNSDQDSLSANEINNSSNTFLAAVNSPQISVTSKRRIIVTAYSSTSDQTDETPFVTASGKWVYDGVIASNFLEFGTKVRFPELFGDKIFTVEDKMHERFADTRVDIWFADRESAKEFGLQEAIMEILE